MKLPPAWIWAPTELNHSPSLTGTATVIASARSSASTARENWSSPRPTWDEHGEGHCRPRVFRYDTLVISVGSLTNDFGTPGVKEHAICLETPAQAARFHRRMVNACIRPCPTRTAAARPAHRRHHRRRCWGIELAAEFHNTTRALVLFGLDHIDPGKDIRIVVIEGAQRIPPAVPERVSNAAMRLLDKIGVEVHQCRGCRSAPGRRPP